MFMDERLLRSTAVFPWPELNRHLYGHLPVPPL